jgi:predicted amidohydrolase
MTAFSRLALLALPLLAGSDPASTASPAHDGWTIYAARDEIAPRAWVQQEPGGRYLLGLAGRGHDSVDGRWVRTVAVKPAAYLVFSADYRAQDVATPARSILVRVLWLDSAGKQIDTAEFPVSSRQASADGWTRVTGTYQSPAAATQAKLELHLRWSGGGQVLWRDVSLSPTSPPTPRKVRVASINHRPRGTKSAQDNLERFGALVEQAAAQKADIVCLPEGITVVGNGKTYPEVAESLPGRSTEYLGELARRHKLYIVAGIYERDGEAIYNTSVLIDRAGKLAGKYRKVCLPREEIDGGLTPGKDYPVFDTDFGRIGMMICWDVHFPEVARELSAGGAEMILMPIWGGNETLARARAIENQIYLVCSGYDFRSAIYDRKGDPLAAAEKDPQVLVAEIDLNERTLWPWLGDWRSRIWREGPARK